MIRYQPKIVVAMPVYQWAPAESSVALAKLISGGVGGGLISGFCHDSFPLLGTARNNMVEDILRRGMDATHVLFLDSDMVPAADVPRRLMAHDQPIVSALYFERGFPFRPVYRLSDGEEPPTTNDVPRGKPVRVELVGFGCILIAMSVFRTIKAPWFVMEKVGEDYHFCRKCKEAGIPILVDTATEVDHMGTIPINRKNAEALLR